MLFDLHDDFRGSSRDLQVTPQSLRHVPESTAPADMTRGAGSVGAVHQGTMASTDPAEVMTRILKKDVSTQSHKGPRAADPLKSLPQGTNGWKFSFDLRKLLDVSTATAAPGANTTNFHAQDTRVRTEPVSTNRQLQHLPLDLEGPAHNTVPEKPRAVYRGEGREPVVFRHALPNLPVVGDSVAVVDKRVAIQPSQTETWKDYDLSGPTARAARGITRSRGVTRKQILLGAKERASFKTDARMMKPLPFGQTKSGFRGVTDHTTTSRQAAVTGGFRKGTTLNSSLKQQTSDAPQKNLTVRSSDRAHRQEAIMTQESSTLLHTYKREGTSVAPFDKTQGASVSQPIARPPVTEHEDAGFSYDNDVIADRGGQLLGAPLRAPKGSGNTPDYAMPFMQSMVEGKEFRRRS